MDYQKSKHIDEFAEQVEALADYDDMGETSEVLEKVIRGVLGRVAAGDGAPVGAIVAMARALVKFNRDEWAKTQSRNQ